MPRIKLWEPIDPDDLPVGLASSLRVANRESKRKWAVCQQVVIDVVQVSAAEVLRLKEQVEMLQRQLERKGVVGNQHINYDAMVKAKIMAGNVVQCGKAEYPEVRAALQKLAAKSVEDGQSIYANIARNEVRRLDKLHGYLGGT